MKTKNFKLSVLVGLFLVGIALVSPAQSFNTSSFLTGQDVLITNSQTVTYGQTAIYTKYGSTWGAGYSTNATTPNYTNTQAIIDLPLWANRDGTVPVANVSIHLLGTDATGTNTLTFLFVGVPRGQGYSASTSSQNQWSVAVAANGTTDVILATNIPTANFQGCGAIRLKTVTSGAAGGTVQIRSVALNGFRP